VIVIDASALSKYILREKNWIEVENYLLKGLYSIDYIVKEVANSLWKHTVVFNRFSEKEYRVAYMILKKIVEEEVIMLENQMRYIDEAVEIAFKNKITVYDSLYIAQALKYGELLTSDKKQVEVAEKLGIKVYYIK